MFAAVALATAWRFVSIVSATDAPCSESDGSRCSDSSSLLQTRVRQKKQTKKLDVENATESFDCLAALQEWERGWSQIKIKWCCETQGIACGELKDNSSNSNLAPHTQGGLMEPQLKLTDNVDIIVAVNTGPISEAGTSSGASMAFQVGSYWTDELDLCQEAEVEAVVARKVRLPSWPNKMRIKARGNDSWGYTDISAYFTDSYNKTSRIVVLDTFHGSLTNKSLSHESATAHARYWVGTANGFPSENVYDVPPLPTEIGSATCITRDDPRVQTFVTHVSPAGTPCVFGVDDADEGSHCIYDNGVYGSFGWCYTSKEGSSWGSCSESCPLYGPFDILGTKLDEALRRINGVRRIISPPSTSGIIEEDTTTGQTMTTTDALVDGPSNTFGTATSLFTTPATDATGTTATVASG